MGKENNKEQLIKIVNELIKEHPTILGIPTILLAKKNKELRNRIIKETDFLDKNTKRKISITERLYCIVNKIKEKKKCKQCENLVSFKNFTIGYRRFCCTSCAFKSKEVKEKIKSTNMERYGVEYILQSKEVQEKGKQTMLKKYGVDNASKSPILKNKREKTILKKYGVENASQSEIIKEKKKQKALEKYGVEYVFQADKVKNKIKETNINKYGVEYILQSKEIKEKGKQTMLKKYGVESPLKSQKIRTKRIQTMKNKFGPKLETFVNIVEESNLKKYGVRNVLQLKEIREKGRQTMLKKYGKEFYSQTDKFKKNFKKTIINKYGVENIFLNKEIKEKIAIKNKEKYGNEIYFKSKDFKLKNKKALLKKRIEDYNYYVVENINKAFNHSILKEDFSEKSVYGPYDLYCKKCGNLIDDKFIYSYSSRRFARCLICNPFLHQISKSEKEVLNYIKEIYNGKFIENERGILKRLELDIYIPEKNMAIEYHGLMFHSIGKHKSSKFNNYKEKDKFKIKHKYKTDQCINKKIQLFHIFENEWLDENKQKIWKNILKNRININNFNDIPKNNPKTTLNFISKQFSDDFLNMYHLEGRIEKNGNFINIGIFNGKENNIDNLLFILTIKILENKEKNNRFKIIRYGINYNIGNRNFNSDELLKQSFNYFLENYIKEKNIKNYNIQVIINLRYSYGKELKKLGFNVIKQTDPNYFYFLPNENILYNKNHDKIKSKSENELFDLGFRKIYDSGNLILEYNKGNTK